VQIKQTIWRRRCLLAGATVAVATPAFAQRAPSARPVARLNAPAAQVQPMLFMTGELGGTFSVIGSDLSVVATEPGFRLMPILSHGSYDNIQGMLNVRGVDLGLVASDTLSYARTQPNLVGLNRLHYIAKLYDNELHLLACDPAIRTVADLAGKRVNVDVEGSGTSITVAAVFDTLGITATFTHETPARGVEMLKRNEVDAIAYAIGKPGGLFHTQPKDSMHFVAVPKNDTLFATYLPATFTAADYPTLVPDGQSVPSIAVSVVLACFGWSADTERYPALERFTQLFIQRFGDLQKPPFHPKWREVSLSADVPGWTRFAPVEGMLRSARREATTEDAGFQAFLSSIGQSGATGTDRERYYSLFHKLRTTVSH